jgi:hypothetical protein
LRKARDLDTQRFRTDARLNDIIRHVAADHPASPLADVERAFGQGEDRTNFLDHVHFAMPGLHLACLTILDALETWYEHSPTAPLRPLVGPPAADALERAQRSRPHAGPARTACRLPSNGAIRSRWSA